MSRSTPAHEAQNTRDAAPRSDRARLLDELRREVGALEAAPEANTGETAAAPWHFDLTEVDAALPERQLPRGALHEITADAYPDMMAAVGFCLGLLKLLPPAPRTAARTVLWSRSRFARREFGALYGHGLRSFGLDPASLLFVDADKAQDVLWTMEEGARAGCLLAVVGETSAPDFKQTQRLSRAAALTQTPVLLLIPPDSARPSTAATRWRIARAPGPPDAYDARAPGPARWHTMLTRCRGGCPKDWFMEWNDEAHRFDLAAGVSDRSPETRRLPQAPERTAERSS
ncbi:ImuA family protein [Dichotomicrobium thermohalophilum]|uniref:Protein ImuA n=1 Tax=Dichotomicrobium thermohalophilum TaxID=933063 RepID=A0A397PE19_9HYPH|nr:inducible mutagenesis protein A [Dichotomicrobium thermohalophilum]RIA47262.1 protein ImuA [Dichotomicrobium thermohalophilum]